MWACVKRLMGRSNLEARVGPRAWRGVGDHQLLWRWMYHTHTDGPLPRMAALIAIKNELHGRAFRARREVANARQHVSQHRCREHT